MSDNEIRLPTCRSEEAAKRRLSVGMSRRARLRSSRSGTRQLSEVHSAGCPADPATLAYPGDYRPEWLRGRAAPPQQNCETSYIQLLNTILRARRLQRFR
jgi:hypothetical protein